METTLNEIINLRELRGLRLVAGQNGLDRKVKNCGILDYELDPELRDKYSYSNFGADQFVLTSFFYLKFGEQQMLEGVKYLVNKGVCALAIKNVYRLQIVNSVLQYANNRNFPIFLFEDRSLLFEDIIVAIYDCVRMREKYDLMQQELDALLNCRLTAQEATQHARQLNPSLLNHLFCISLLPVSESFDLDSIRQHIKEKACHSGVVTVIPYRNGLFVIYSDEALTKDEYSHRINCIMSVLYSMATVKRCGVSQVYHHLSQLPQALKEAYYAMLLHRTEKYLAYEQMGAFRVVFPHSSSEVMQSFSREVLANLVDYDAKYASNLLVTLLTYVEEGADIRRTAEQLALHENTVRYRLEKVSRLNGLKWYVANDYEQLALAARIHICGQLLEETGFHPEIL